MVRRSSKLEYDLVSSLERDPLLKERLRRLRTVPGVGSITALSWALEIGDYTRFRSNRQAISYCGLCADEKSSADKVTRMPLSKQRNKHIQRVLVEAAQAGAARVTRTGNDPTPRVGKRKSQSGHACSCQEDGLLHDGGRTQTTGFFADRRRIKPFPN